MNNEVYLICIWVGDKYKVSITSPGYNSNIKCIIPNYMKAHGRIYKCLASNIYFSKGYFLKKSYYKIKYRHLEVVSKYSRVSLQDKKLYTEKNNECIICFENPKEVVIIPCGHLIMCALCSYKVRKKYEECPKCRQQIEDYCLNSEYFY